MTEQTASFSLPGYTELQWMARGGFSSVYRSVQVQYQRPVAIKVLDVGLDDERSRRQYQRECDATGRLTGHPNIVTVLDSGFAPNGKPFLVMDLCTNGTMGDRLAREGPLPVADVLRTGVKMAAALEAAHQTGILHRDLKPANILITAYGEPALSDFGIAAVTSHLEASVTMSAMTPNHAPPEVLEGHRPSPASDIYSLASTLYTLLAGRPPFAQEAGHSILAFITRVLTAEVPPIPRSDVPDQLFQVLTTALAKDPADRQASAAVFGYELQLVQVALGIPYTEMVTRTGDTDPSFRTTGLTDVVTEAPPAAAVASAAMAAPTAAPDAAETVAPPAPVDTGAAAPVGDATVVRPGATSLDDLSTPAGGATPSAAGASGSGPTVAPPTPNLEDRLAPEGEMTMAVDRHAPVIERVAVEGPPPKKSKTPMVIALVVLLLLVLGGGAFLATRRGTDTATGTTDTTAAPGASTSTSVDASATTVDPSGTVPSTASSSPTSSGSPATTGDVTPTSTGSAEGEPPAGVNSRLRDAGGQIVVDVSWQNPAEAKLPVLYQLLGADGSSLSRISTLAGGTSSVIVTDTDTGPLVPDTTYCVAVGFISTSAKALWAPAACTDGTTLQITR